MNIKGKNMKSKKIKEENIEIIPKNEIHKLREKKNNYCICIPIINEGERLKKNFKELLIMELQTLQI